MTDCSFTLLCLSHVPMLLLVGMVSSYVGSHSVAFPLFIMTQLKCQVLEEGFLIPPLPDVPLAASDSSAVCYSSLIIGLSLVLTLSSLRTDHLDIPAALSKEPRSL